MLFAYLFMMLVAKLLESFADWLCPPSQSRRTSKYYMKPVDNEGELFFTDATNFDEAFRI